MPHDKRVVLWRFTRFNIYIRYLFSNPSDLREGPEENAHLYNTGQQTTLASAFSLWILSRSSWNTKGHNNWSTLKLLKHSERRRNIVRLAVTPRRYSDYPDAYTAWNVISSIGSIISFVGVIIFIFIIWERISTNRQILFPTQTRNSIEWFQNTPPPVNSYS